MRARGPACWDAKYYLETYKDVVDTGFNISTAWEHYVQYGQFEDRLERYALPLENDNHCTSKQEHICRCIKAVNFAET